jgi:hypothetical protein
MSDRYAGADDDGGGGAVAWSRCASATPHGTAPHDLLKAR